MILECFEYNQHFVAMMNVINAARLNPPSQGQKHHIIPRCWFKKNYIKIDNSKNNLVLLSLEDHIKVHRLAAMCAKEEYIKSAMKSAANYIAHEGIFNMKNDTVLHSKLKGIPLSKIHKEKISNSNMGHAVTEETKNKISKANKGRKYSKETCDNLSKIRKGKSHTEKWKQNYIKIIREKRDAFIKYKKLGGSLSWNQWQSLNKVTR